MTTPPWAHKVLHDLVGIVKDVPRFFALRFWHWMADLHEPLEVGPPDYAWCPTCKRPWPCELFVSATDEIKRYQPKEDA